MPENAALLERDGAVQLKSLVADRLDIWQALTTAHFEIGKPGLRIVGDERLAEAIAELLRQQSLADAMGEGEWQCVRAIAFDKSPSTNWALTWHQDRTIAVVERCHAPGFRTWSIKDGIAHVEPPFALLERMRTLRVHLDDVDDSNGALLAALGSHGRGRVPDTDAVKVANECKLRTCNAHAGDVWLYATPILHASARSTATRRRRVLQLDVSRDELPAPLAWRGVG